MADNALQAHRESPWCWGIVVASCRSIRSKSPTEVRVMNSGSSSLKFSLVDHSTEEVRVQGLAESLGTLDAVLHLSPNTGNTTY
jgi:hypothetical protein